MFSEEELVDTLVIDRAGCICGFIAGFTIEPNQIIANPYDYYIKKVEAPNEEELVDRLRIGS